MITCSQAKKEAGFVTSIAMLVLKPINIINFPVAYLMYLAAYGRRGYIFVK